MDAIYQHQILMLAKSARASVSLETFTHHATLMNPTCGDQVEIRLLLNEGKIEKASTVVRGCALCEAGAGLFLTLSQGRLPKEITDLRQDFKDWLSDGDAAKPALGMEKFEPIRAIRNRHKCVTLAFEAGGKALTQTE